MAQIRCGHIPLNVYLFRINRSETDYCQACPDHKGHPLRREMVNVGLTRKKEES